MRKCITLVISLAILSTTFASSTLLHPATSSPDILIRNSRSNHTFSLMDIATMKVKDVEKMTGKKMNLGDKILFKIAQRRLRNSIDANGKIDSKQLKKLLFSQTHKRDAVGDSHKWLMLTLFTLALAVLLSILGIFVPFLFILSGLAGLACVIFFIIWLISLAD